MNPTRAEFLNGGVGAALLALQQRVDRLERQGAAQGEQLTPNYLTVTGGLVGAKFSGQIAAQGVVLPAAETSPWQPQQRVAWQRVSNNAVVADIAGEYLSGEAIAAVSSYNPAGGQTPSTVSLTASTGIPTARADWIQLLVHAADATNGNLADVVVGPVAGIGTAVIADQNGKSTFLQVANGPRQLTMDFGLAVVNFPNSAIATQLTVNHGLGRAPSMGLANAGSNTSFGAVLSAYCGNFTSTTFTINATSSVSLNFGVGFYWLVIG